MTQYGTRAVALGAAVLMLASCAHRARPERYGAATQPYGHWSYVHTSLDPFWWREPVDVAGARASAGTGTGATIAIVGTGVLAGHEDLLTVVSGESTCGPPSDTQDYNGHGTQLAGIAAGREDPVATTRGVAPGAAIIPIKVDCVVVSAPALLKGVDAAIGRTPDIILIAIGGYPSPPPDVFGGLSERITRHREILFVVASAWDGTYYTFPEWTTKDNALLVAAMTWDADPGDRARIKKETEIPYTARRGSIWAPGRGVGTAGIETEPGSTKHAQFSMHGTSPAAAIVAGCAALVTSKKKMDGKALKDALLASAEPQPGLGPAPNNKRLNCAKAIP